MHTTLATSLIFVIILCCSGCSQQNDSNSPCGTTEIGMTKGATNAVIYPKCEPDEGKMKNDSCEDIEKKFDPLTSPDGTISVSITPEEAKEALIRWAKNENNENQEIRVRMESLKNAFESGQYPDVQRLGKWVYRETDESVLRPDNSSEKEMSWHYVAYIEGWKCELVKCKAVFMIAHTWIHAHFEKNPNGWVVVVDSKHHQTPHALGF